MTGLTAGFFGKIPSRGDFVRHGIGRDALAALDAWCQSELPASRERLGEHWSPAWMEAPIWRFRLRAGACGPEALAGLWLPSTDRAGRLFPLMIVAAGPGLDGADALLDEAERVALAAIEHDVGPEQIAAALTRASLAAPSRPLPAPEGAWWTAGGPRVAPARRTLPGLPAGDAFVAMLTD